MPVTRQNLYVAYAKHTRLGLDELHEPGTDPDCAVCDEINLITAQLGGHPEATSVVTLDPVTKPQSKAIPQLWEIEEQDGTMRIVRTVTHRQEESLLKRALTS